MSASDYELLRQEMEYELKQEAHNEHMLRSDFDYCMERHIEAIEEAQGLLNSVVKSLESYGWDISREEALNYV